MVVVDLWPPGNARETFSMSEICNDIDIESTVRLLRRRVIGW